ncbi:hypothetical protein PAXINDRAFT_20772 [Paxillus involutus ATCC 200175]|uniref:Uncharacterized protein n=1 Tax=Paxillus involutus ATCC 200175 TaxID=664439 RepID=A0A0C9TFG9_PAXIN|nr:hypothetical protein PAXINDRAFT_20772 [Paxillus involutus ATCC 200175]
MSGALAANLSMNEALNHRQVHWESSVSGQVGHHTDDLDRCIDDLECENQDLRVDLTNEAHEWTWEGEDTITTLEQCIAKLQGEATARQQDLTTARAGEGLGWILESRVHTLIP